ncbi:MAG TPA: Uma2 family endonuclease [Phaeodactylibacter sp.]|nr:Uma2 family endonuclease [Phaeodactylibacter sp.]
MITDLNQLDLDKKYTYADYLTWQFDERVELIRGKIFKMSPAPNRFHQEISSELLFIIGNYLQKKSCRVYHAPFDVRLPLPPNKQKSTKINTVVQPDICVICDLSKLDVQGCNGAPDWIIEILSPATSQKDLTEKFDIYQHAGVQEYWVVYPFEKIIAPYRLDKNGRYQLLRTNPFVIGEKIPVGVFSDFEIDLKKVFSA